MGTSNSCLEMCASQRTRQEDKDQVLEALGIGPMKMLKKEQNMEDLLSGKKALKQATAKSNYPLETRLSTIREE